MVNFIEFINFRMEEDSDWQNDILHFSISSFGFDLFLSGLDIVDNVFFNHWPLEVVSFAVYLRGKSEDFIEFDGIVTHINYNQNRKVP